MADFLKKIIDHLNNNNLSVAFDLSENNKDKNTRFKRGFFMI